jgi:hypothetical protein
MVTLDGLATFFNDFMGDVGDKDPHMPNGLQVRGREEVELLATGVSASMRLFEEAVARKADALLVHHGPEMSWRREGWRKSEVACLRQTSLTDAWCSTPNSGMIERGGAGT